MPDLVLGDPSEPLTLAGARERLNGLAALDLEPAEADQLLNEGHRELCCRSEWTRRTAAIGPTVEGQTGYELPEDTYRVLNLTVGSTMYGASDLETVQRLGAGTLALRRAGLWYISHDDEGAEQVVLHPSPTAGQVLGLLIVYRPALLTEDEDTFKVPQEHQRGILAYAAAQAFMAKEDNNEAGQFYMEGFEQQVVALRRLRYSRAGRQVRQARIVGIHV